MINTFECSKDIKVRLWIDELPNSMIKAPPVFETKVVTYCNEKWNVSKIGLELYLPRRHHSNYGFLGIEILSSNEQNTLCAKVHSSNSNNALFKDTIAYEEKTVYCGLPDEYSEPINRKIQDFMQTNPNLPSGTIDFIAGAHCEVGSSKVVFGMIADTLLNILSLNKREYSTLEIQKYLDDILVFQ